MENNTARANKLLPFIVGFFLCYFLIQDFSIPLISVYGIFFLALILSLLSRKNIILEISKTKKVYLFWIGTITLFSILPGANLDHLSISLLVSMLIFSSYVVFANPSFRQVKKIMFVIQAVAIAFSLYVVVINLIPDLYWNIIYPHLPESVQEYVAYLLSMGEYAIPVGGNATNYLHIIYIALVFRLVQMLHKPIRTITAKIIFGSVSLILLVGMLIANIRTQMLSFVCVSVLLFILGSNWSRKKTVGKRISICAIILFTVLLIVICMGAQGYLNRYIRPLQMLLSGEIDFNTFTSYRWELWKQAFSLFLQHPIFGIGWHRFIGLNTYEHEVHNTYLQVLCETGLVGFLLICVPWVYLCVRGIRNYLRLKHFPENAKMIWMKNISLLSIGIQSDLLILNAIDMYFYKMIFFSFLGFAIILQSVVEKYILSVAVRPKRTFSREAVLPAREYPNSDRDDDQWAKDKSA